MNENWAMNTLLSRSSPTCTGSLGEYVWKKNSPYPQGFDIRND